ncbi:UDP-N-acetylmuramoyl-L-alanine--D-glutamate ligase [Neisseria sp. Ec49-e6-T10]|uniref:UDP-N-acetylmuramoyl-L-alanine--D-glutamate ligase n=1 Tax=Neisseria sp. Ec49-e6-T10 TaxID=3140744 RepID=UPI003EBA8DE0
MELKNKKVLVLGLGATGLSLLKFLQKEQAIVAGFDTHLSDVQAKQIHDASPDTPLYSGVLANVLQQNNFDILALSPGVPSTLPEIVQFKIQGKPVVGDVEIFAQKIKQTDSKVIAITGSNGKTTVTSLVGFLCEQLGLKTVVAGNIGLPVLDAWTMNEHTLPDVWVLELSSFQLDTTTSLNATAATVLNISEDHLERYTDLLEYAYSKSHIFGANSVQVLNLDDLLCRAMARPNHRTIWFSLQKKTDFWVDITENNLPILKQDQVCVSFNDLPLQGLHNAANILVALALCEAIGLPLTKLIAQLPAFKGLPHRVEKIGEKDGVIFIDDSKGTNVGATCAALAGFHQPIVLIAGGLGKGQNFTPLRDALVNKARALVLIGQDAKIIESACQNLPIPIIHCQTLEDATRIAFDQAHSGDIVLLSPACASLDMFTGYAHRAQVFIDGFSELINNHVTQ